jgi:hypothetical protein
MTKLLEDAIATVRTLPEEEQDAVADAMFAYVAGRGDYRLTEEQIKEVKQIQRELHDGKLQLATEEEMASFWKTLGL